MATPAVEFTDPWGRSVRVTRYVVRSIPIPARGRPDVIACLSKTGGFTPTSGRLVEQVGRFGTAITVPLRGGHFACDAVDEGRSGPPDLSRIEPWSPRSG